MKNLTTFILVLAGLMILVTSCDLIDVDPVSDPNNLDAAVVLENPSDGDLQNLAIGLEAVNRNYNSATSGWWSLSGTISRELYYINTSDPNFSQTWLQIPPVPVPAEDDNTFFVDASGYETPYFAIRHSNLLLESLENADFLSDAERNAYTGFASTLKAYQFQMPLMHQYQNGIRVDVTFAEPLEPGGFLSYDDALAEIRRILNTAATNLENAGDTFPFPLSEGFNGFMNPDDPITTGEMLQINRAIAARYALYAEDWQGALNALEDSFLNLSTGQTESDLYVGPAHTFGGGNDLFNPYFFVDEANENLLIVPSPAFIADAEAGDMRIERKLDERTLPVEVNDLPDLSVAYQDGRFATATSSMPFIRNEELLLIYAEANIQLGGANLSDAVDAINIIRTAWGLDPYSGTVDQASLIDEMLNQRRYSLWGEGHRWVDMRRYDRLDEIDTSADGGRVATQIGRPQGEIDWEAFDSQ
jgi:hypothetical protein